MKTKFVAVLIAILFSMNHMQAQSSSLFIDSLKVFPQNPKTNDSVKVISYNKITMNGPRIYQNHFFQDTSIMLYSCYLLGQIQEIVWRQDTFLLGYLLEGTYRVRYQLGLPLYYEVDSNFDCLSYPYYDSAFVNFTVSEPNSISSTPLNVGLGLHPNPATNQLTITTEPTPNTNLQLLSIEGKQIITTPLTQSTQSIDISMLPGGLYFAVLQNEQGRVVRKFVKAAP